MFERILWNSRLIIIVAVVSALLVAVATLLTATADVVHLLKLAFTYASATSEAEAHMSTKIVALAVKSIDGYLLTAIMIIFSLGLYELFVSKIDAAEDSDVAQRVLLIQDMDDLKDRLAKLVILILVITFFEHALEITYHSAIDIVYLALGTALVGLALYASSRSGHHGSVKSDKS
jgi:uncharacterized membrane protein YqhA